MATHACSGCQRLRGSDENSGLAAKWDRYTSKLQGAGFTDRELLRAVAHGKVLDIGCGTAKLLGTLERGTFKVGLDAGFAGLRRGGSAFPDLSLICGDVYRLPLRRESFDVVVMIDVIEHLEEPALALKRVADLLKPGGNLFVQTPNYPVKRCYDLWYWLRGSRLTVKDDPTHVFRFTRSRLMSAVRQSGLEVKELTVRNILCERYFVALRRWRQSNVGLLLGQKLIVVAQKR